MVTGKPTHAKADPPAGIPRAAPPRGGMPMRHLVRRTWHASWAVLGLVAGYAFGLQLGSVLLGLLLAPLCALAMATTVAALTQFSTGLLRRLMGARAGQPDR